MRTSSPELKLHRDGRGFHGSPHGPASRRCTARCMDLAFGRGEDEKNSSVVTEAKRVSAAEPGMFQEARNHWAQVFRVQAGSEANIDEWLRRWAHR